MSIVNYSQISLKIIIFFSEKLRHGINIMATGLNEHNGNIFSSLGASPLLAGNFNAFMF